MNLHNHKQLRADWAGNNSLIKLDLTLILYVDERGIHHAFLPALDLDGVGNSEEDASKSLKIMLDDYLDYITKNNTVERDLRKYGWNINPNTKKISPPDISSLINRSGNLRHLFQEGDFKKTNTKISLPAFA